MFRYGDGDKQDIVQAWGYPVPQSRPIPYSLASTHSYLSELKLPKYKNLPISKLSNPEYFPSINFTGLLVEDSAFRTPLGTAVLISPNTALVARHSIEISRTAIKLFLDDRRTRAQSFKVVNYRPDPNGFDIAVITLEGKPGEQYGYAQLESIDQPRGRHVMVHFAGGEVKQISTGDFVDSEDALIEHQLWIDGGPCASGAGIFNMAGRLIGINVYRTSEYYAISRKTVLVSQSALFHSSAYSLVSRDSPLRPFEVSPSALEQPIVQIYRHPKYVPHLPVTPAYNQNLRSRSLPFLSMGSFMSHRQSYFLKFSLDIEQDSYEGWSDQDLVNMNNRDAARRLSRSDQERRNRLLRCESGDRDAFLAELCSKVPSKPFTQKFLSDHVYRGQFSKRQEASYVSSTRGYSEEVGDKGSTTVIMSEEEGRKEVVAALQQLKSEDLVRSGDSYQIRMGALHTTQRSYPMLHSAVSFSRPGRRRTESPERACAQFDYALKIEGGEAKIHHFQKISRP